VSVLIVGAESDEPLAAALVARLLEQDDEVRVLEPRSDAAERWRGAGAFVAAGGEVDADLVERAGQNVRTIVALGTGAEELGPILEGARAARVSRVVHFARRPDAGAVAALENSGIDFIALSGGGGRLTKRRWSTEQLAVAIDAADDVAGEHRVALDLDREEAWAALGLEQPHR
jgi:hypothetical protein